MLNNNTEYPHKLWYNYFLGCPIDFSHTAGSAATKFTFPHPASVYLAAAQNHPAMALAAMANSASIVPGSSIPSSSENLFVNNPTANNLFSNKPVLNTLFPQIPPMNNTTEVNFNKMENVSGSLTTPSVCSQTSFLSTQLNEIQSTTTSALKAALQFSTSTSSSSCSSSEVKSSSSNVCKH